MRNFVQHGDIVTATAPAGGVSAGDGVLIENLFGVAATSAEAGEEFELNTTGVYELPKQSIDTIAFGQRVYWLASESVVSETDNTAEGFPIGVAVKAAGNGATTVRVRLDGIATAGT